MKLHELITSNVATQEVETIQKPYAYSTKVNVYQQPVFSRAIQNLKCTTPNFGVGFLSL